MNYRAVYCLNEDYSMLDKAQPADTVLVTDDRECARAFKRAGGCVIGVVGTEDIHQMDFPEADALVTEAEALTDDFVRRTFCHFHGLPFTVAETERLVIRESVPEDFEVIGPMLRETSSGAYVDGFDRSSIESREGFEQYIGAVYRMLGFGFWTVARKVDGQIVGWCGLFLADNPDYLKEPDKSRERFRIELGYLMGTAFRGKGYAVEACRKIVSYAFEEIGADKVTIRTRRDNPAAVRVAQQLKFCLVKEEGPYLEFAVTG